MPDVGRRHRDILREAAIPIDTDDLRVWADVRVAGAAEQAPPIDDVSFRGHTIAFPDVGHQRADLHHFARELVADDERWLAAPARPRIPLVNVDVRAAAPGATPANQFFVLANRRLSDVLQCEPRSRRFFHERFHARSLLSLSSTSAATTGAAPLANRNLAPSRV